MMGRDMIVVGPSPDEIGGMAAVVAQMLRIDFEKRYVPAHFPITIGTDCREPWWRRAGRHLQQIRRLRETIGKSVSPIVHIHTCSGFSFYRSAVDLIVAGSVDCRTVLHIHGAKFDAFFEGEPAYRRRLIRWILQGADRVIALSEGWRDKLHRMAPRARIEVVENAVEAPSVPCNDNQSGTVRFVVLARMDTWKGIDDLLSACMTLRSESVGFELVLAGPPGSAGDAVTLPRKIRAMDLSKLVRYIGPVQGRRKEELLAGADVYVQASRNEGLPISLLEALAWRLPVVATRVGAVPEVITDGREGVLVPPGRPECLAAAMRSLIEDPCRREQMAGAAKELSERRFGISRFRDDLLRLYDGLTCPGAVAISRSTAATAIGGVPKVIGGMGGRA